MVIAGMIIVALFILYAIARSSGEADERADEIAEAMRQEQEDAEAWERITK